MNVGGNKTLNKGLMRGKQRSTSTKELYDYGEI
jgi:hypothetical protein